MAAITWRNIDMGAGGDARAIALPMQVAMQGINTGFDKLTGVYDKYEKQQVDQNTALFQNELSKYRTPEELQAARDSGAIAALQERFGLQMDQKVRNEGARTQLNNAYEDVTNANKYSDMKLGREIFTPEQRIRNEMEKTLLDTKLVGANVNNVNASAEGTRERTRGDRNTNDAYMTPEAVEKRRQMALSDALVAQLTGVKANEGMGPLGVQARETSTKADIGKSEESILEQKDNLRNREAEAEVKAAIKSLSSSPVTESQKVAAIDKIVAEAGVKYDLPMTKVNELYANGTKGLNGAPATDLRTSQLKQESAINNALTDRLKDQSKMFDKDSGDLLDMNKTVKEYMFSRMDANRWGDANREDAFNVVSGYVGKNIDVPNPADGGKTSILVPIGPAMIKLAFDSGAINERSWIAGGGNQFNGKKEFEKKLREVAQTPAYQNALRAKQLLDNGTSARKIREMYNIK